MNTEDSTSHLPGLPDTRRDVTDVVRDKLSDAETPGFFAEFDPDEAERAGAFSEDALSEADAFDAVFDLPEGHLAPANK